MATLTEGARRSEFVISDGGERSYRTATLLSGENVVAGTLLGRVTANGKYRYHATANVDGSQTFAGVIALEAVNATSGDKSIVILTADAEVMDAKLTYATGLSAQAKDDIRFGLAKQGIQVRV